MFNFQILGCLLLITLIAAMPKATPSCSCPKPTYIDINNMRRCAEPYDDLYIFLTQVCDGKINCPKGTDEDNCPTGKKILLQC